MKNKFLLIIFILCAIQTSKAQKETFNLTVNISGLNSSDGNLLVGIYNKKESFLKKPIKSAIVKVESKKALVLFRNLPKGIYAVSFVHDENDNKKMDTNFIGIPKEDYGCSNNAIGFMGPPKYKDAKFVLEEDKTIEINL
ncbi:DUF2141 domain-containing protein [uncultured Polaribacter sp.]|uniref:DUF2141 domain-containing protein n=1 Tax=uncultured Polaribacter sp. TaxID=174711 RepID=UPI0037039B12